ncbi:MAG: YoaK family protein [Acidobacteriaceae bacterium]
MKNLPAEHNAGIFLSTALAFVGGYTDAATYVTSEVFAGHLSGNLVLAAISLLARDWKSSAIRCAALLSMVVAIAASTLLDAEAVRNSRIPRLSIALLLETILFLVPGTLAFERHPLPTIVATVMLCLAMGLQTGVLRRSNGVSIYTAFIAGIMTRVVETETEKLEGRPKSSSAQRTTLGSLLVAFIIGAAAGAAMALYARRWSVGAAGLVLLALAAVHYFLVHHGSQAR